MKRVPSFEREMVRQMVEGMAKHALSGVEGADGLTTINFDVADMMLKKVKEFYGVQQEGASGYFAGIEKRDVEKNLES